MEILFFIAVAAVLVILWFRGNLFACVFASLPTAAAGAVGLIIAANDNPKACFWIFFATTITLGIIWAPRLYLRG